MNAVYSRRRSRAGETQSGCLMFILLMVVAGFVGYNYFVKNYNLKHAGKQVYAWTDRNPEAFNQYKTSMAKFTIPDTINAAERAKKLFADLKSGRIDQKTYNKESEKLITRLSELIDNVNGRAAPKIFHEPAIKLAESQGDLYKCLTKLQKLPSAKTDEERKAIYDNAWNDWLRAWKNAQYAKSLIRFDITFEQSQ